MPDTRPEFSPMPQAAAEIGQRVVDRIKPLLDEAFASVLALPGHPSEREQDALSVLSNVATFAQLQLISRLMERKKVGLDVAASVALGDVAKRVTLELNELLAARAERVH